LTFRKIIFVLAKLIMVKIGRKKYLAAEDKFPFWQSISETAKSAKISYPKVIVFDGQNRRP